ncbi:MAG: hypothetical protein NT061_13455 [Spirochaetes bacterium]|nr:hypothetical protein [Spirochaetota bacterium]
MEAAEETGTDITALSVYGNTLGEDEAGQETRGSIQKLLEAAPRFGCRLVSVFAGRDQDSF